jgi:PLP dependent protein
MAAEAWGDARTAEIAESLARVRERIQKAATDAGRDPAELTLIAVTKTFPVDDARRLVALGVPDLGEARDQEARAKARELPAARWHFVGRLQRNKARSVASYAAMVHTLDRPALVDPLTAGAERAGRDRLDVLVQVSLDGDPRRGGALPADAVPLADAAEATGRLHVAGVMAISPLGVDPDSAFADLARVAERLRAAHPAATIVSAGMSGDLEAAVRNHATHLRIGTALLGGRPPSPR